MRNWAVHSVKYLKWPKINEYRENHFKSSENQAREGLNEKMAEKTVHLREKDEFEFVNSASIQQRSSCVCLCKAEMEHKEHRFMLIGF